LIQFIEPPGLFAFAGQCRAQGRKEKTGGEASGREENSWGGQEQRIGEKGGGGGGDSGVQGAGSHSEPEECGIFGWK